MLDQFSRGVNRHHARAIVLVAKRYTNLRSRYHRALQIRWRSDNREDIGVAGQTERSEPGWHARVLSPSQTRHILGICTSKAGTGSGKPLRSKSPMRIELEPLAYAELPYRPRYGDTPRGAIPHNRADNWTVAPKRSPLPDRLTDADADADINGFDSLPFRCRNDRLDIDSVFDGGSHRMNEAISPSPVCFTSCPPFEDSAPARFRHVREVPP